MASGTKNDPGTGFPNPFGDVTKMFEQFKVPGIDMTSIIDSRRKDIEALVEANKAAYEAMQALVRAQTEMLTSAMQGLQEGAKGMASGGFSDPKKQSEAAGQAWQKMLSDMKDIADMARKAQTDALASMTHRATENMGELKQMLLPK